MGLVTSHERFHISFRRICSLRGTGMRYCVLALVVLIIGYSATCSLRGDNSSAATPKPQDEVTVLRPVPAVLNEGTHPAIEATETQIQGSRGSPFNFRQAQFINETHGWAMTLGSLYRTEDGGKSWERLSQEPEKDARFTAFTFVDELHGWLSIVRMDSAESYGVGISSVIMITEDGGSTWKLQASFQDEKEINEVRFLNEDYGLAVGHRGLGSRADRG